CGNASLAGVGTDNLPEARILCVVPLRSGLQGECLGVLALAPHRSTSASAEQRLFMDVFARQVALALERVRLADAANQENIKTQSCDGTRDASSPIAQLSGSHNRRSI